MQANQSLLEGNAELARHSTGDGGSFPHNKDALTRGATTKRCPPIMLVAGEASADEHGAAVVRSLKKIMPNCEIFGMGGSLLRAAGMDTVVDAEKHASVMGFTEIVSKLREIFAAFGVLVNAAKKRKPAVAVLLDFPDFNLRLAKALHKQGVRVIYFISPQLWAWRSYRVHTIKKHVEKVAAIFPFEVDFYHQHAVDAEYVGHPFLDRPAISGDREEFLRSLGLNPELPVVALLPGSRRAEVEHVFGPMLGALQHLRAGRPGVQAVVPVAPTLSKDWLKSFVDDTTQVTFVDGRAREVLRAANVAVVTSGTATVEAALSETPFCVVYKMSPVSYRIAKTLVRGVKHIAMANLIAGKQIVQEFIQDDVTPENIAAELEQFLGNPERSKKVSAELHSVVSILRRDLKAELSAPTRVAELVQELLLSQKSTKRYGPK